MAFSLLIQPVGNVRMLSDGGFGSLIVTAALKTLALPAGPNSESEEFWAQVDASHHNPNPIRLALGTEYE